MRFLACAADSERFGDHTMQRLLVTLLVLTLSYSCNGASNENVDCWPRMSSGFSAIFGQTFVPLDLSSTQVTVERQALRNELAVCLDNVEFQYAPVPGRETSEYTTLLDVAIAADDVGLLRKVLDRMSPDLVNRVTSLEPNSNDYHPIYLAVVLESENAFDELQKFGVSANLSFSPGYTPLHVASGHTDAGLRIIRQLAELGLGVNTPTVRGASPLLEARKRGDVRAVQCLVLMGANVPESKYLTDVESLTKAASENQRLIDEFLLDAEPKPDSKVQEICRRGQLGP